MENTEKLNDATPRQRWALYCITKKDYRNEVLSKEEAAKLIQELGDPNYKKKSAKDLRHQLWEYLQANFEEYIWNHCCESLKIQSVIMEDKPESEKPKKYAFIGMGCGITYFTYRKNSKRAKAIVDAAENLFNNELEEMFLSKFTKQERDYYSNIGCSLEAIWGQDQNIQSARYYLVTKFAEENGVKLDYKSYLD